MRRVEEVDLSACERVNERRQEGSIGVCERESEMLYVMTDPRKSLDAAGLGECVGREGQVGAHEETLGDQVATGGVGEAERAYVFLGEKLKESLAYALLLPEAVERERR